MKGRPLRLQTLPAPRHLASPLPRHFTASPPRRPHARLAPQSFSSFLLLLLYSLPISFLVLFPYSFLSSLLFFILFLVSSSPFFRCCLIATFSTSAYLCLHACMHRYCLSSLLFFFLHRRLHLSLFSSSPCFSVFTVVLKCPMPYALEA